MNIVVIVSDTFRADHLGCYGNKDIFTPHLDQFAQQGFQFNNCHAASFPTVPARADLFTGKFTFTYLGWASLPRNEKTLPEILKEAGYTTIGVVDTPFLLRDGYGYDRGFDEFLWVQGQGKNKEMRRVRSKRRYEEDYCAPKTMSTAEKMLEDYHQEEFFLYVDTWDPHEPWDPPSWYAKRYSRDNFDHFVYPCYGDWRKKGLKWEEVEFAHACYCAEITMVDHWIGRLLDRIKSLGLWDSTAILFTSDHGFYFGEHGYFGKGVRDKIARADTPEQFERWYWSPLYQEITRVPLIVYFPGVKAGQAEALVSLVDLMPTLLELAGVDIPSTVQGQSLLLLMKQNVGNNRDFVVTSWPLYNVGDTTRVVDDFERMIKEPQPSTITTKKWTLLYGTDEYPAELYHVLNDPTQTKNIINENWEIAQDLHRKFVTFLEQVGTQEKILTPRRRLSK